MRKGSKTDRGTTRRWPERLAVGFALALALASPAPGGDNTAALPRFALAVDGGPASVREAGFGRGWRLGTGVFFRTGHRMGTEILLDRFSVPVALGAADLPSAGRMSMTTLMLNEQLYVLTEGPVLPYAMMGIGFAFPSFRPASWPEGTPRRVFVDRLALQAGAGLDVRLANGLALCGKARYNLVKTWMEDAGRTYPIRDDDPLAQNMLHLYALELALGLKIAF